MSIKLQDAEIKVMRVLWKNGDMYAKDIAILTTNEYGWNKNTTYTLIKRCIEKGAIKRFEPAFLCKPIVTKEQIQVEETNELIDKIFDGSSDMLFSSILSQKGISSERIAQLKELILEEERNSGS